MSCSSRIKASRYCPRRRIKVDIVTLIFNNIEGDIIDFKIEGSADPCVALIAVGLRVSNARHCLLSNRFKITKRTPNLLVFERNNLKKRKKKTKK
ncbi:hypothetical protein [Brevibacillus laterosporus]|uniref:hypothetical protein n=1 Tax=Brevibacillus laterosporus TaxID=1465 RepID=UPI0003B1C084|nr:hypothetical protein [Brevibacillus laterosporus]ERM16124.1 hypothetical protein P615_05425 [Brevibacillus laterosporus PE36]